MDPTLIGLRTQDFHESLKVVTTFGPKEVKFKNTLLIGKASSLAMHLRGLLYIDQYEQIEYAAASLGINSIELPAVLRELETIDFIRITKSGEQVKRIDVKVPEFRSGYSELGKRWQDLRPNELEQAGIASLEHLHHGPVAVPVLQSQYSLNSNEFAIMSDVMMCGQLLAIQTVDGTPTAYSPLAVDGNPSAYLQWAKRFPNEVTAAIETLSQSQGLAMSDGRIASNKTLMDAIQTGVIMPVTVKDLPLKLQFRRILFAEGYWSPIEVELSNYEDLGNTLKRRSLTDLDVLGIKFDRLFNRTCVVGDCKSGRNVSDANRLFWLRGVKDYFGADLAYYLRPNVDSHIAAIAPKMGLCALPASHLDGLELRLRAKETSAALGDLADFETTLQRWGIGTTKGVSPSQEQLQKKRVYSFLSYTYWYIERFRALMQLVGTFESVAHVLSPEDDRDVLLAFVGAERFAHCLLEAAAFVHSHGLQNIPNHARLYFYGGPFGLREKERTFDLIRKLGVVNEDLDPPWLRDTIELLGRMLLNPNGACDVLRYISVAYVSCVLQKKQEVIIPNANGSPVESVVLAKDIILQFAKATGIRESIFDSIRSM